MRELSLHMLDLLENSTRGGASIVLIAIEASEKDNRLRICIEDNGTGLPCSADQALDPFFTTKGGKKTGLGLSLFQGAAEQAGGMLELGPSSLGGLKVEARMQLSHVDRQPLGDVAATISSVLCVHNGLDLWFRLSTDLRCFTLRFSDFAEQHNALGRMALIRKFTETIKNQFTEAATDSHAL